ncbi:DUF4928 family protein [Salmonella enterica]|nr:DUF4928 family protein [Salmonella enterica]
MSSTKTLRRYLFRLRKLSSATISKKCDKIREGLARLIRTYNTRINAIEIDKSLMIDEPRWVINILGRFRC